MDSKNEIFKKNNLFELCQFVVKENYNHHSKSADKEYITEEVNKMYYEELEYSGNSVTYVSRKNDEIIGSIRVLKYSDNMILPLEKLFSINPLMYVSDTSTIWHIGRFAVKKNQSTQLFKSLMVHALSHVYNQKESHLFIECDLKLARILSILNIKYCVLSAPIVYLGSPTVPLWITRKDITSFFLSHQHLQSKIIKLECL